QQMNISPKRLMMPLSVAGLISGMMTLIATAPNLVVNAELIRNTDFRFHFFDFTPIGRSCTDHGDFIYVSGAPLVN
ncbi:hypothetical protein AAUPMC_20586, partial [Pasteurella multocida subsp. multocida str. Anand1_cattle]